MRKRLAKSLSNRVYPGLKQLLGSRKRLAAAISAVLGGLLIFRGFKGKKNRQKHNLGFTFLKNLTKVVSIAIPSMNSKELLLVISLGVAFVARTLLSIEIAKVNGKIAEAIVSRECYSFFGRVGNLLLFAVPASLVNSGLDFLTKKLALALRDNLSRFYYEKYFLGMTFYQIVNLDNRVSSPHYTLTQEIEYWSTTCSSLYCNLVKPLLDIWLFTKNLAESVGIEGPLAIIAWYFISALTIRCFSPSLGRLYSQQQGLESAYKKLHTHAVLYSEEIAFYRGSVWLKNKISQDFLKIVQHLKEIIFKRFLMGSFDSVFVKYGATIIAYVVLSLPIFGSQRKPYLLKINKDPALITRDYIRNSTLLINLAKAIGRLASSYKKLPIFATSTSMIVTTGIVLDDVANGKFIRTLLGTCPYTYSHRGNYIISDSISFEQVPIVTNNGEILINSLTFRIDPGMHTFVQGPSGCGKSSIFRVLCGIWPLYAGVIRRPAPTDTFYIPQKPYIPKGTLRDIMIYPDFIENMRNKDFTDEDLIQIAGFVQIDDFIQSHGGLGTPGDWDSLLTIKQKQQIVMCRVIYHKPKYLILDECTSALSTQFEDKIYEHLQELDMTLITISFRENLLKFHPFVLRLDGEGGWKYIKKISN